MQFSGLAVATDGSILVAGTTTNSAETDGVALRLTSKGELAAACDGGAPPLEALPWQATTTRPAISLAVASLTDRGAVSEVADAPLVVATVPLPTTVSCSR